MKYLLRPIQSKQNVSEINTLFNGGKAFSSTSVLPLTESAKTLTNSFVSKLMKLYRTSLRLVLELPSRKMIPHWNYWKSLTSKIFFQLIHGIFGVPAWQVFGLAGLTKVHSFLRTIVMVKMIHYEMQFCRQTPTWCRLTNLQ